MIVGWMLYCIAASSLVALAALALEKTFRLGRLPLRWVWVGALLGSLLLAAIPWIRPVPASASRDVRHGGGAVHRSAPVPVVRTPRILPLQAGGWKPDLARRRVGLDRPLVLLWAVLSSSGFLFLVGSHRALLRQRRRWRWTRVDGVLALLSRDTGPAVIGYLDGIIVLPRWVLTMGNTERRLVLAHEEEHLRAGDSRTLLLALGALVLMPWNVALWWQLWRLRHAIELDCDARVIARHPDAKTYGALLIEVGERASGRGVAYAAFASSTFLERRIKAMFQRKPRGWKALAGVSAALAMLLVGFACEVPRPTMAEPALLSVADRGPTEAARVAGSLAPDGPRSSAVPGAPDTLTVYLRDAVMKLRVRRPEEEDVPEPAPAVCGDGIGEDDNDLGELWWPNCGGYKLYRDHSVLPAKVYPVVRRVVVDGPAWKAGLRSGDILLSIDGRDARLLVGHFLNLRNPAAQPLDAPYRVRIQRGAEEHELGFPVHYAL